MSNKGTGEKDEATLFEWFQKNCYDWVSHSLIRSIINICESNGLSINCESSETVMLDSQEGVTQNLNADQLILLADGLYEDSSRPYLDYLFQQMKESDTVKELSEHAMEMIRIMEDARELEAAYRMTNLYAAQFAKMRELAPENLKMGRGR